LWYVQGTTALAQNNYRQAVVHFQRLVEYAPYVSEFHLQLAKAYFYNKRFAHARLVLEQAAQLAKSTTEKTTYSAKLEALKLHAAMD
jgi:Flp pilus assembly protein TadD